MDTIVRAAFIYFFLLVVLRASGRRTLAQATPFDLVLLLLVSEVVQQAIVGAGDDSVTTAMIAVTTLVALDVALSLAKARWHSFGKVLDGVPMILVEHGQKFETRMKYARIDEDEILEAARNHGLTSLDQIDYAILETTGKVSIIPKRLMAVGKRR